VVTAVNSTDESSVEFTAVTTRLRNWSAACRRSHASL